MNLKEGQISSSFGKILSFKKIIFDINLLFIFYYCPIFHVLKRLSEMLSDKIQVFSYWVKHFSFIKALSTSLKWDIMVWF